MSIGPSSVLQLQGEPRMPFGAILYLTANDNDKAPVGSGKIISFYSAPDPTRFTSNGFG